VSTVSCNTPDEPFAQKSVRRTPVRSSSHGGSAVFFRLDARLLAGVDIPGRIFRIVSRHYLLPYEEKPEALRATHARRPDRREGTDAKDHNVFRVARIYRSPRFPRPRSSLRLVSPAAVPSPGRGRTCRARFSRRFLCVQRKSVYLRHHRIGPRPKSYIHWPVRPCTEPDVRRSSGHASRDTDCPRFMVGIARHPRDDAGPYMETI